MPVIPEYRAKIERSLRKNRRASEAARTSEEPIGLVVPKVLITLTPAAGNSKATKIRKNPMFPETQTTIQRTAEKNIVSE